MKTQSTTSAQRRQPLWLVSAMTTLYCKHIHRGSQLCPQCSALLAFETAREQQCCKTPGNSACKECHRQCYPDATRLEINHIVRWAEPKMRWRKPLLVARYYMGSLFN
ncbi:nitrous oxide-stimulated promoter family protein [Enterovibrio paralichthyis]|uniref:nitrous oxide-stimulated promoter family protein n=1 Tax=Enterovibrio paralichthyis TaxID=2853805 RepID=UPI0006D23F79|nr:nitrous oxide-stimulated promoter family protein [Enterovibrio paralichthyis]MBV7297553.1 nitrous oxide-stimulated promoter family protein [Enterovibrio paralichthyis]